MKDRNQPQGCEQLDATTDTNNSNGNDAAASSCSSGSKDPDNKLVPNPRATNDTKPQIQPEQDAYSLQHRRPSCAAASDSKDDTSPGVVDTPRSSPPPPPPPQAVISSTNEENPTSEWDDAILTPRTLAKLDQNEDRLEEGSITRNEEDERYLETHRRETDYNDLDDDYDLKDDILFECFEGATSPIQENADDVDAQENDIESSQAAYRIGLSDPAFDELHELIDKEYKGPEADEPEADDGCEAGMNSSFLFDALEDDLRELDDM
ncbi:hypothetical protein DRE_01465 [Drechslerella stenobrocha 248]|uniref:Uncharacterized protein n=1 Tax=Drechslerella stenobrocha 248 TaxID=1043628 RepID=W7HUR9_9PEZI|nr:hypothetical protein DRE_01465 [Drechslerella stenobrocha 248]